MLNIVDGTFFVFPYRSNIDSRVASELAQQASAVYGLLAQALKALLLLLLFVRLFVCVWYDTRDLARANMRYMPPSEKHPIILHVKYLLPAINISSYA